jgi:hypothetical protein
MRIQKPRFSRHGLDNQGKIASRREKKSRRHHRKNIAKMDVNGKTIRCHRDGQENMSLVKLINYKYLFLKPGKEIFVVDQFCVYQLRPGVERCLTAIERMISQ